MPAAPLPPNEAERLAALRRYRLLETPPEDALDDLSAYAAERFKVPIAFITLVDADRQWFKSCVGVELTETPRDMAFCAYTILDATPLIVPDATLDPRFQDNPVVVGEPFVRFYAGAPLVTHDGYRIGTLCLLDLQPRAFDAEQVEALQKLAKIVSVKLQLRLSELNLKQASERILSIYEV